MATDKTISMNVYEIWTSEDAGSVVTVALTNQLANVCVAPPTDAQQDTIRLFRRGGSLTATHYKVGDFPVSTLSQGVCSPTALQIVDNVPDNELTDPIELDNDMPISGISNTNTPLPFIWGPYARRVLGCGDSSRPDAVYFSKEGNADAWPPQNWVSVSSPSDAMMGGCVYNTRCFAFSTERMWELVPGLVAGVTFSPFPTPTLHGLISPWGLCVFDYVYFVAKDGIYRTSGGPEESIVENWIKPLFPTKDGPGRDAHGYEAVDMTAIAQIRLNYHNDEIYFTYQGVTTGNMQTLVWDTRKSRWRAADYNPELYVFYSEPGTTSSLLMGGPNGTFAQATEGQDMGNDIPVVLRTGSNDQGLPLVQKEYGSVIFDLDPGGATVLKPITITPYINGEAVAEAAITVTGSGRQQVPLTLGDVMAFNLEFEITWTRDATISPVLYQYDILYRVEPAAVTHWEARENSYGIPGYWHVRDGYIGLRSTANVTLQFTLDGVAIPSITLASTAGLRKKVYFSLPGGYKQKLLKLSVDSSASFRIYEGDVEMRAKPWINPLGYAVIRVVGAESTMATGAYTSMLLTGGQG